MEPHVLLERHEAGRRRRPGGELGDKIVATFGSYEKFVEDFKAAAVGRFGSGWAWLVADNGELKIVSTPNAEMPAAPGVTPLLVVDVWEHAYYLDYQNLRPVYVQAFFDKLVNWDFAAANRAAPSSRRRAARGRVGGGREAGGGRKPAPGLHHARGAPGRTVGRLLIASVHCDEQKRACRERRSQCRGPDRLVLEGHAEESAAQRRSLRPPLLDASLMVLAGLLVWGAVHHLAAERRALREYRPELILTSEITAKADLLQRLPRQPELIFFGGSRAERFDPEHARSKTGLTSFNLAVTNSHPEGAWALANWLYDRRPGAKLRWIWGMNSATLSDRDLDPALLQDQRFSWYLR